MPEPPVTVLFLCTGNSCRSIMAEALLNQLAEGKLRGLSAGSQPTGEAHPLALSCLARNRTPAAQPRSKSWSKFTHQHIDLVITVCDNAAGEICPVFPGKPAKLHWGLPDPAKAEGSPNEIFAEFQAVYDQLRELISELIKAFDNRQGESVEARLKQVDFQKLLAKRAS